MKDGTFSLFVFILPVFGFLAGAWIGTNDNANTMEKFKKEAIELNHAYYHPQTAQFTWKTNCND